MTAPCPGDVQADAWGRVQMVPGLQSKGFFSFGRASGRWKPGRTRVGSGSEEDCRRNAAASEQCDLGEAFRGTWAGWQDRAKEAQGAGAGSLEELG